MEKGPKKFGDYRIAQPQKQTPMRPVTIKELISEPDTYYNFPSYQRRKVWPLKYDQAEVESILSGASLPSVKAYREVDALGQQKYFCTDGRQRFSAIYDFVHNKFRTWTPAEKELAEPNSLPPTEPGKFFKDLSPEAKNHFLNYVVYIMMQDKGSDKEQREQFRRDQNHMGLSAAEKISTYESRAIDDAMRIEQHPFWSEFYFGRTRDQNRKKVFQSSLYLLALELSPDGMASVGGTPFIHLLASGKRDKEITEDVIEDVLHRLDVVCHVFHGAQFTCRAAAIVMYQSVRFLEDAEIVIEQKHKGVLTAWINNIISDSNHADNVIGYQRPLQQMVRKPVQRAFWAKHLKTIMVLFGVDQEQAS